MTGNPQKQKAREAKILLAHYLSLDRPGRDLDEIESIVDLILEAAVEEAVRGMREALPAAARQALVEALSRADQM